MSRPIAECLQQYEALRHWALERAPEKGAAGGSGLEFAFLEHQGLAAWLAHSPDNPPPAASAAVGPPPTARQGEALGHDWVVVLGDLVVGDRSKEVLHV